MSAGDEMITKNVIDGRILSRNGGSYTAKQNVVSLIDALLLRMVSRSLDAASIRGDFVQRDRE